MPLAFTVKHMPQYAWGFIFLAVNTLISAYLYSTKRTKEALIINVLHSFVFNSLIIILLPMLPCKNFRKYLTKSLRM